MDSMKSPTTDNVPCLHHPSNIWCHRWPLHAIVKMLCPTAVTFSLRYSAVSGKIVCPMPNLRSSLKSVWNICRAVKMCTIRQCLFDWLLVCGMWMHVLLLRSCMIVATKLNRKLWTRLQSDPVSMDWQSRFWCGARRIERFQRRPLLYRCRPEYSSAYTFHRCVLLPHVCHSIECVHLVHRSHFHWLAHGRTHWTQWSRKFAAIQRHHSTLQTQCTPAECGIKYFYFG